MRRFTLCLLLCCLLAAPAAVPQTGDTTLLSIDRLFASREFSPVPPGHIRWLDGGEAYTILEPSQEGEGGREIVRYETATGKRSVLVPALRLKPEGAEKPLLPESYDWSADKRLLLIGTNTRRVWRVNSRGDYWILPLKEGVMWKLGGDAPESSLQFAKFSPAGKHVAYVRASNLYVQDLESRAIRQLTFDGSRTTINGTFDWVYEEEFGLRDGYRWSPDGTKIAFWHLDASGVREFYLVNTTDSLYPFITPVQYPKVGQTLSACSLGVVSAEGGETVWMEIPGDPRNTYVPRMDWSGNSSEIAFQHMNRLQNTDRMMLGDAATGKTRVVLADRDSAWFEVVDPVEWLGKGKIFTWLSEREGFNRLYLHGRDGTLLRVLTPPGQDVLEVSRIDEKGGWAYFLASPSNATQRYLYRVRLDGKGVLERVTPEKQPGRHAYDVSPDGRWAVHTWSSFGTPPVTEIVSLPRHETVRTLTDNRALAARLKGLKRGRQEFFQLEIPGGIRLDGWRMLPPDFDSTKRYPVIVHVYGEPAGQTVLDGWGGMTYLWHLMLTQKGYVVLSVDNRGTPAPKGRAWRKSIYRQIGILASADQAAALRAVRNWPWVDSTRIGIWGWSGGGSMTLNAMFRYPDLYQVGLAVAFVSDQRLYDAIYQERYMGLPEDNPEGYRDGSPITHVAGLRGKLLIVHGTGDDNVHYQSAERLVNALIKENKQFRMMAYPNRSHGISEGANTTRHLYTLFTEHFLEHLPPGPR
jgi:dipeptidyl-peptidase-4